MRMADKKKGELLSDSIQPLNLRSLYQVANMSFVIPDPVMPGDFGIVKAPKDEPTNMSAITFEISSNGESETVYVLGGKGVTKSPVVTELAGLKIYLAYGSKEYKLPFSITLNDFIADGRKTWRLVRNRIADVFDVTNGALRDNAMHKDKVIFRTVSYTHLTLPTICSV